jgi:hypothetical protein
LVKKEVTKIQSMLTEDGSSYDFEPTEIKLEDLYLHDEDEKKFFFTFDSKEKYLNWHYKVHGKTHLMEHPKAEEYLNEVVNMRDECIDMLYVALEGGFDILINPTFHKQIETRKIITKKVREFLNSKKNKSDSYVYFTIRPDHTKVTIDQFKKKIDKLFKLKCINKYYYAYEQKFGSEKIDEKTNKKQYTKLGDGFHIHGIIKFNTSQPFFNANQQLKRSIKGLKWYNDIKPPYIGKDIYQDKLYYLGVNYNNDQDYTENMLLNYKNDIDKNKCLQYDKEFRIQNDLKYIYTN